MGIAHETDCFLSLDKYIRMYHAYVHDTYTDKQTPPPTHHAHKRTHTFPNAVDEFDDQLRSVVAWSSLAPNYYSPGHHVQVWVGLQPCTAVQRNRRHTL